MSLANKWGLVGAFFLHFLFLASVFDIYFTSPIIPSSRHHAPDYTAPAKRLVLFVADGLRAESIYGHPERAPFLNKVASSLGSWGTSHTKLPTESRPGHVALIAGMFEDPSAITRGIILYIYSNPTHTFVTNCAFLYLSSRLARKSGRL